MTNKTHFLNKVQKYNKKIIICIHIKYNINTNNTIIKRTLFRTFCYYDICLSNTKYRKITATDLHIVTFELH